MFLWGMEDGEWGGWEAGVSIMKYSKAFLFCALFSLLIGCTDLAQEMKNISPLMLLQMLPQSDSHLSQKGGGRCDQ